MITYSFYESDTRVQQYAKALVSRGDSVDIVALRRQGAPRCETIDGVRIYRIQSRVTDVWHPLSYLLRVLFFFLCAALFVSRKHLRERYQLIHVHSVPDFLVFAAIVPKWLGARVILDIHDILPEFYASKFGCGPHSPVFKSLLFLERRSVAFADYTIVANDLWYERVRTRSDRGGRCMAIRNYPDSQVFFPRPRNQSVDKFVILYPGTLNWHQGVDVAVRAFAKISDKVPEAEFQIYGEGPERNSLVALARQLGLDGRVAFKDFLPTDEIAEVMGRADLAVVPKRASSAFGNEAASTKIFEFMALGVPLVVSKTKIDQHYFDESSVKFFESENEEDLAQAMLTMTRDHQVREAFASAARRYAATNLWEAKKQEYLALVDTLTNNAARGAHPR